MIVKVLLELHWFMFFHLEFSDKLREANLVNWQSSLCTWQVCFHQSRAAPSGCTWEIKISWRAISLLQLLSCGLVLPGMAQACWIVKTTKWPEYVRQSLPLAENLWYPDAACLSEVSCVPWNCLAHWSLWMPCLESKLKGSSSFAFESLSTQPASKAWKGMMSLLKGSISSAEAQTSLDAGVP